MLCAVRKHLKQEWFSVTKTQKKLQSNKESRLFQFDIEIVITVADPGGGAKGAMAPPSVPDKDYLLCTSWHFLFKKNF